jgi:extracellular factor (EF) 3-hydroxypalmitic acid methyl ester biosynthesis protein
MSMLHSLEYDLDFATMKSTAAGSERLHLTGMMEKIEAGNVSIGVALLVSQLSRLRSRTNTDEWRRFIGEEARQHPIKDLLHTDPFTHHAYSKPRGYPGDAELLDFIYEPQAALPQDAIGNEIFAYTTNAAAPRAVRHRGDAIANLVDTVAEELRQPPRVLSVACGHLREVRLSKALVAGKVAEWLAIDQDEKSLDVINRDYGHLAVTTRHGSVKQILVRGLNDWGFDLIYAAGLFDYLSQPVGRRLCDVLFAALNPGGRLLVPNFMPGIKDAGYMEAFMDWFLIYRTEAQVRDLTFGIPTSELSDIRSWTDAEQNVVYVMAQKRRMLAAN